ncbi:unnamed protein product [Caenorhabditis auriculariae]|uniref:Uncharacterized protein n=1 Tax=Caenorhabditis auriculariae TaxID=2777116 RepID=A0A8S1HPK2_9PELO|nr:unnamed protein product [Caenorhabditis auriculariae]
MQNGGWLRASRSEHHLPTVDLQNARISSLLEEMRPKKLDDVLRVNVEDSTLRCPPAPPKYDDLYNDVSSSNVNLARRAPPDYSQLSSLRPSVSTWIVTSSDPRPQQPSWARYPKPLAVGDSRGPLSPAGYFRELELKNLSLSNRRSENKNNEEPPPMSPRVFSAGMSRNTPRQASFIAAIARHPLRETSQWNGAYSPSSSVEPPVDAANVAGEPRENVAPNANTPVRRPRSPTPYKRRKHPPKERLGKDEEVLPAPQLKNTLQRQEE